MPLKTKQNIQRQRASFQVSQSSSSSFDVQHKRQKRDRVIEISEHEGIPPQPTIYRFLKQNTGCIAIMTGLPRVVYKTDFRISQGKLENRRKSKGPTDFAMKS